VAGAKYESRSAHDWTAWTGWTGFGGEHEAHLMVIRPTKPTAGELKAKAIVTPERGRVGHLGRPGRVSEGHTSLLEVVETFLTDYITLPPFAATVIAAWVLAAWMLNAWDRFPHLSIYSPEKRCGKTRLLEVLKLIVPNALSTSSISPAALYRIIGTTQMRPTIILDEAQSLSRVKSESGEVIRELLNAGIEKDAKVIRCGGKKMDKVVEYPTYSPKIFAQIGEPDGVLADRSLPIEMKRKTEQDTVIRFRSREVLPRAKAIRDRLETWTEETEKQAVEVYSSIEPLDIENDRMADLLMPLQTVLRLTGGEGLETLSAYAASLDERDKRPESQSWGVRLLTACREIFEAEEDNAFIPTSALIERLVSRSEEIWSRWNRGDGMNPEALAKLLRPFGISSQQNKKRTQRGYFLADFQDAFERYLVPLEKPSNPSILSSPSGGRKS
jgi:hypothetical protein